MTQPHIPFQINLSFEPKAIAGLLSSAMNGVGYWCCVKKTYTSSSGRKIVPMFGGTIEPFVDYPVQGGLVSCAVREDLADASQKGRTYPLDGASVMSGLRVMALKYPRHFANFLSDNYDAITGDVFVQCCLFGEILFG